MTSPLAKDQGFVYDPVTDAELPSYDGELRFFRVSWHEQGRWIRAADTKGRPLRPFKKPHDRLDTSPGESIWIADKAVFTDGKLKWEGMYDDKGKVRRSFDTAEAHTVYEKQIKKRRKLQQRNTVSSRPSHSAQQVETQGPSVKKVQALRIQVRKFGETSSQWISLDKAVKDKKEDSVQYTYELQVSYDKLPFQLVLDEDTRTKFQAEGVSGLQWAKYYLRNALGEKDAKKGVCKKHQRSAKVQPRRVMRSRGQPTGTKPQPPVRDKGPSPYALLMMPDLGQGNSTMLQSFASYADVSSHPHGHLQNLHQPPQHSGANYSRIASGDHPSNPLCL